MFCAFGLPICCGCLFSVFSFIAYTFLVIKKSGSPVLFFPGAIYALKPCLAQSSDSMTYTFFKSLSINGYRTFVYYERIGHGFWPVKWPSGISGI